ncbi:MAG: UDP-glucose/GDP-mannose dehydrogenase family protein [Bdellovibrionaceae bacterium]|nr:UDP-glucose/GDP-mannose dehydrogenase family protein [Pseudobdellovibrionaceae bacterium]
MQISIFGAGYVGLVTGVCFSEMGNEVLCVDVDAKKVALMNEGQSPIFEPGLEEMMNSNIKGRRLSFSTDLAEAVRRSDLLFIAVGTPSDVDGSADLKYVLQVTETIAREMNGPKCVVIKSTVPVGTNKKVRDLITEILAERGVNHHFDVVSNPEFLREGAAIEESMKPARVIVGASSERAAELMGRLYEPFLKKGQPMLVMDPTSAEMTKYAANSMLASRISIMNEFSRICEKVGADIEWVRRGLGSDPRIGPHFIYPGIGYGGSCFPKDVQALIRTGVENDERLEIMEAVVRTNQRQRENFVDKVRRQLGGLSGKRLAVWGVAFKPFTDDIREAPALDVIRAFLAEGATVQAYDPAATEPAKAFFGQVPGLTFSEDQYSVLEDVDALCVITEWKSFREPNFERMKKSMKQHLIFDGRNIYNPKAMREMHIKYFAIGRPQ